METSNSALKGHSLYFEEWLWKLLHDLIFKSKSYITWNFKCNFYLMKFNQTLNRKKKGEQVKKKQTKKNPKTITCHEASFCIAVLPLYKSKEQDT